MVRFSTVLELDDLLGALALEAAGDGRYTATNAASATGTVFGGQLLGQSIVAASHGHDDKRVKTIHTVFARAARPDAGLDIVVEPIHAGRTFASSTVTIFQGGRLCVRSQVLLSADEPDVIRHEEPAPEVGSPEDWAPAVDGSWQVRIVDDIDVSDPA